MTESHGYKEASARRSSALEMDFSRALTDEQWLGELSALELPARLAVADPRVIWELHPHFSPLAAQKYRYGSLLSCFIAFENGYTASLKFGFDSTPSASEHLGVGCLVGDRSRRSLAEVFDFSSGGVVAFPPDASGRALEMVCESSSAKIALLALRQIESLPDPLTPASRGLWRAIEADDEPLARALWARLDLAERSAQTPWRSVAVEHALASGAERCSRWLLEEERALRPGWPRLGSLARAALKDLVSEEERRSMGAPGLLWLLRAQAPLSLEAMAAEFSDAPAAALPKAQRALREAQIKAEREELAHSVGPEREADPLRGAL